MLRRLATAGLLWIVLVSASRGADRPAQAPSPPQSQTQADHPKFEQLKKLVGTWVEADSNGQPTDKVVSVVRLTAGGSAVQETLFPGEPMEMVSIYHMDNQDLLMTHYCALGNQPRMKADPASAQNQIRWKFAGGTNLDPSKDMHMHSATVTFVDDDHIQIEGESWEGGKPSAEHCGVMKLVRKH